MTCFTKTHQCNGTNCEFEKYVNMSNFFVLNSLDKSHLNSVCAQYVCDKSENARVCAKWQWNTLDCCYWIALLALYDLISIGNQGFPLCVSHNSLIFILGISIIRKLLFILKQGWSLCDIFLTLVSGHTESLLSRQSPVSILMTMLVLWWPHDISNVINLKTWFRDKMVVKCLIPLYKGPFFT